MLERQLNTIGLQIDHGDKLKAILFKRSRRMQDDVTSIEVHHPDGTSTHMPFGKVWRYLDFFFEANLLWKAHVKHCKLKVVAMAQVLRMFANCPRSLSLAHSQTVYLMAVQPLLTYGVLVWYMGNQQKHLTNMLQVGQNEGVCFAAGTFWT